MSTRMQSGTNPALTPDVLTGTDNGRWRKHTETGEVIFVVDPAVQARLDEQRDAVTAYEAQELAPFQQREADERARRAEVWHTAYQTLPSALRAELESTRAALRAAERDRDAAQTRQQQHAATRPAPHQVSAWSKQRSILADETTAYTLLAREAAERYEAVAAQARTQLQATLTGMHALADTGVRIAVEQRKLAEQLARYDEGQARDHVAAVGRVLDALHLEPLQTFETFAATGRAIDTVEQPGT